MADPSEPPYEPAEGSPREEAGGGGGDRLKTTKDQREQLQKEYELLQKKIDTHSTFKFLIRGWSFTALGAAAVALFGKQLGAVSGSLIFLALVIAALVFHVMATGQAILVRALSVRAAQVERDLHRIWPGADRNGWPLSPSPGLVKAMTRQRFSSHERILTTFIPSLGLVALRLQRRPHLTPSPSAGEGHQPAPTKPIVGRSVRCVLVRYTRAVLRLSWALSTVQNAARSETTVPFERWWQVRYDRLRTARDDTYIFWIQLVVLAVCIGAAVISSRHTIGTPVAKPSNAARSSASAPALNTADGGIPDTGRFNDLSGHTAQFARDAGTSNTSSSTDTMKDASLRTQRGSSLPKTRRKHK